MRLRDLPAHLQPAARAALERTTPAPRLPRPPRPVPPDPAPIGEIASAPMRLVIPFAALVPDNRRAVVIGGEVWLSKRYAEAKAAVHQLAQGQLRGRAPFAGDVALVGHVWLPDRRRRDTSNLTKMLHDALIRLAYLDDAQIADHRYIRRGLDRENPRVELTITPMSEDHDDEQ